MGEPCSFGQCGGMVVHVTKGMVSQTQGGEGETATTRTSLNGFDVDSQTAKDVKHRAFSLLRIPYDERMADGIQILRYELKQAYIAHHDSFPIGQSSDFNWDPQQGGGNRLATVLLYLSDEKGVKGGQTVFPHAQPINRSSAGLDSVTQHRPDSESDGQTSQQSGAQSIEQWISGSEAESAGLFKAGEASWQVDLVKQCFSQGLAVKPKRGDAIMFYSQKPDGSLDDSSLHGGCPVLSGTKWAANVWVWNAPRFGM